MRKAALETARLLLRPLSVKDAPELLRLSREETLRRQMPDQVYASLREAEEAAAFLQKSAAAGEWPFVLGIVLRANGELIGHTGLSGIPEGIEIGYAIAMAHQGRGYAAEAVRAFSPWACRRFALARLWAVLRADNIPSRRVLEKAGYCLEWERKREAFGETCPCLGYIYTPEETG